MGSHLDFPFLVGQHFPLQNLREAPKQAVAQKEDYFSTGQVENKTSLVRDRCD